MRAELPLDTGKRICRGVAVTHNRAARCTAAVLGVATRNEERKHGLERCRSFSFLLLLFFFVVFSSRTRAFSPRGVGLSRGQPSSESWPLFRSNLCDLSGRLVDASLRTGQNRDRLISIYTAVSIEQRDREQRTL